MVLKLSGYPKKYPRALGFLPRRWFRGSLPFCHVTLSAARPKDKNLPATIVSIGDHIRTRRINLGLLQKDAADLIGVTASSILNWEKNRSDPAIRFIPSVVEFLGYDTNDDQMPRSIGDKLKAQRTKLGLSRRRLADLLQIDQSNLAGWETGRHKPTKKSLRLIDDFLSWRSLKQR